MEPPDRHGEPPAPERNPHHRGVRHLRVGIELGRDGARVSSIWAVDQPAVQFDRIRSPIFARVDVGTATVLVEGFADPRITRSTYREKLGHHYGVAPAGIVYVSVPYTDLRELAEIRIRVIDGTKAARQPGGDPKTVAAVFDDPPASTPVVADVDAASLRHHPDWGTVADAIGLPMTHGCFQIQRGLDGRFRWRLRRANGDLVAESASAYPTREACEADIAWVKANAPDLGISASDAEPNPCG